MGRLQIWCKLRRLREIESLSCPRLLLLHDNYFHTLKRRLLRVFVAVPKYGSADSEHYKRD